MSSLDIISTVNTIIRLGLELKNRLRSFSQADEELQLLITNLNLLLTVFKNPTNKGLFEAHVSEFVNTLDVLQSIANSVTKCAEALDIDHFGAESRSRKFLMRIWAFYKIPDLLAEIQRKAEQLQKVHSAITNVILNDIRTRQGETDGREIVRSIPAVTTPTILETTLDLNLSTDLACIDQLVGNLLKECKYLRERLQEAILCPDTLMLENYQIQNPEGASFWRDRFQRNELKASALRYETLYVSWARFVHEVETSFVLKKIPTGILQTGDIDLMRAQGSRYCIDQNGTRRLSTIRPLWLPALRSALDPLQKGYVKPQDYFNLLRDSSLSDTLRKLAHEDSGYGIFVECERTSNDLPFPAAFENPNDHVGWVSAQIVAVPTPAELGIVSERDVMASSSEDLFAYFNKMQDVHVYVRYLQTGQIEQKSLSMQVRPIGGIAIGAPLCIRHELESGDHAWSSDLPITEFKACYGGGYIITAGAGPKAIVFSTRLLKDSFDGILRDDNSADFIVPEFDCSLLGPSKVFGCPPQVGEKVQIEHDGFWYDMKVTLVDGDEIEYTDWNNLPKQVSGNDTQAKNNSMSDEEDGGSLFLPEEQLRQLGKGTRRPWRLWRRDIRNPGVRPYRRFHIGDSIEAPVMYPDFRWHYHITGNSQLYLPARIVGVQGDQYIIDFSPALTVHLWWPGRVSKGEKIELVPGSGATVDNPFDFNRVTVGMDMVRPFSAGPRPTLGVQSAKPSQWSSYQGLHLSKLENLLERSLWNDHDSQQTFQNEE